MKVSKTGTIFWLSAVALLAVGGYLWHVTWQYSGPPEKISIGTPPTELGRLLFVSEQQGFLARNGLEATVELYQTGKYATRDAKTGKLDVAGCAEFVLVSDILAGNDNLRCLATYGYGKITELIARRDRGIAKPEDLRGKKIGFPRGTIAEFFLGRFLTLAKLSIKDIEIIGLDPLDLEPALAQGKADAVMAWDPVTYEIKRQMGDKIVVWPGQQNQRCYALLLAREEVIKNRPKALEKLLRALIQAEEFLAAHPEARTAVIAQRLNIPPEAGKERLSYTVSLDQGLLLAMEDEARWMMENNLARPQKLPNFLDYIYPDSLRKVNPKAVSMIIPPDKGAAGR